VLISFQNKTADKVDTAVINKDVRLQVFVQLILPNVFRAELFPNMWFV